MSGAGEVEFGEGGHSVIRNNGEKDSRNEASKHRDGLWLGEGGGGEGGSVVLDSGIKGS